MKQIRLKSIWITLLIAGSLATTTTVYSNETVPNQPTETQITESTEKSHPLSLEEYANMGALELAELIKNGQTTSEELVSLAYDMYNIENPKTNAVITTRKEEALTEARTLQNTGQPFYGVPLLVKGLGHSIAGGKNSNGIPFAKDVVSKGTSSIVRSLQTLGFIVIGQTNYPQLGLKNISDSVLYGPTGSAWNPAYQAGGSSGGSGAGVAGGMTPVASGSDAGGSIRIPAAWNGIVGLKPSRGIIQGNSMSLKGQVVHFPLTKNMADTEALFHHLLKEPINDSGTSLEGIKVGYTTTSPVGTPVSASAKAVVMDAVAFLQSQGIQTEEVTLPVNGVTLMEDYYTIGAGAAGIAQLSANQILGRGLQLDDVDLLTWALYQTKKLISNEDVQAAWDRNYEAAAAMEAFYESTPLLLTPSTAAVAPLLNDPLLTEEHANQIRLIDQLETKEERQQLVYDQWLTALTYTPFTQLANLTGQPAISLPTGIGENNLPLGIQFSAGLNQDQRLIDMGKLFEEKGQFKQKNISIDDESTDEPTENTDSSNEETSDSSSESSIEDTTESNLSSNSSDTNTSESNSTLNDTSDVNSGSIGSDAHTSETESSVNDASPSDSNSTTPQQTHKPNNSESDPKKKPGILPQTNEQKHLLLPVLGFGVVSFSFILYTRRQKK